MEESMKVLWLCNIVLPDFSSEFGLRKNNAGGWMTGMLHQLESREDLDIAICCPIIDSWRAKDGVCNNHRYYSFPLVASEYRDNVKERFRVILGDYVPDVIHIWGTEYPHTLEMVNACEESGLLDRVVINIQGLVSVCAQHYYADVPDRYRTMVVKGYPTIKEGCDDFARKGKYEIEALKKVRHVIGRTDWDEACTKKINPDAEYHFCNEILRDEFYRHVGEWNYEACEQHTIFVSQAGYPIKGLHYLLKAMPDILQCYPDAHVYVGGHDVTQPNFDGDVRPYGQYIKDLLDEYGLAEHVTFLGQLNEQEMIAQYKRANVFVSASTIENESNSISEAVLIGCPTVSSLVGGVVSRARVIGEFVYQHDAEYMLSYYINKIFAQQDFSCSCEAMRNIVHNVKNAGALHQIYGAILGGQCAYNNLK